MITNFEEIVSLCNQELVDRGYNQKYYETIQAQWNAVRQWLSKNNIQEFSEEIGKRYCVETFGTYLMLDNPSSTQRIKLRAVRMLISYQKTGDFEFRVPKVEYEFDGEIGNLALSYIEYCQTVLLLSEKTIQGKILYLYNFCKYMNCNGFDIDNLSTDKMENFFLSMNYSLPSRHNSSRTIKLFLKYVYETGHSSKDSSVYVLKDNYKNNCKLPTTYEEYEIKEILSSVERASAIGKRDYLILLLIIEYGWRAKDVTDFSFDNIDWENNVIRFTQHKTKVETEFPLLSTVGNAIIDYLKNARPNTCAQQIIVSMESINAGKPLSSPTIHSIVAKHMRLAGINDWQSKKHGPHALRHSLATNLLKNNVAMPIISTVLGHQHTSSTSTYIAVDFEKLKQCALPMPVLRSPFYSSGKSHGKI